MRWFCDKLVASFVPRLIGSIYRCRRIGEVGAQQMQVDVGTLKAALLDLPTLGQASATGAYTKLVTDEIGKAEQVLKLVQTPEDMLEETGQEMDRNGISIDLHQYDSRSLRDAANHGSHGDARLVTGECRYDLSLDSAHCREHMRGTTLTAAM